MCKHKCQASKIFEFLYSRSLLSRTWESKKEALLAKLHDVVTLAHNTAENVQVIDYIRKKKSSGHRIGFSDIDPILALLLSGPDARARRWLFFGEYTSPLIKQLLSIQHEFSANNIEQADRCCSLRNSVLEMRDLQRDIGDTKLSLVDVSEKLHANELGIEHDTAALVQLLQNYSLLEPSSTSPEEIDARVRAHFSRLREEDQVSLRAAINHPALHMFMHDYNERYSRDLSFDNNIDPGAIELIIEELVAYCHVATETPTVVTEILSGIQSQLVGRDYDDACNAELSQIYRLRDKISANKNGAKLAQLETNLRESLQKNEARLPELRQEIRQLAIDAQTSINKIFPAGLELIVD